LKKVLALIFLSLTACCYRSLAQHPDSLSVKKDSLDLQQLNEYFTHQDSLDIFDLIDSLLKLGPIQQNSMLGVRLAYNSNVVADNRTFNISQFGLAPGVTYYHKSGLYADVSTYWSKEYSPEFYLTTTSAGYLHTFNKWYSLFAEYTHYFYNQPKDSTVSIPYSNNFGLSNYFDYKHVILRLDYYFYFGDKYAHRIMPSLGYNFIKKNWLGFNRVSIYPTANVLFGSEQITEYNIYPNVAARIFLNRTTGSKLPLTYESYHNAFGVMNYSLSTALNLTKKNWTFLLGYTYNIPKALPGEDLTLENSGYLSFSITRYFQFKK
jgi:hypothetical protein